MSPELDKVSFLLAISQTDFGKSIVKPRIKVGREFVNQGRNLQQVIKNNLTFHVTIAAAINYLAIKLSFYKNS